MSSVVGDGLELVDVEVIIDNIGWVLASGVIHQSVVAGLQGRHSMSFVYTSRERTIVLPV